MGIDLRNVFVVHPRGDRQNRKDVLWVIEQALASTSCSAVLSWEKKLHPRDLRRLNLAGREGQTWGILFRTTHASRDASPAELRIILDGQPHTDHAPHRELEVQILKRKGGCATGTFRVNLLDSLEPDLLKPPEALPKDLGAMISVSDIKSTSHLTLIEPDAPKVIASLERIERKQAARERG